MSFLGDVTASPSRASFLRSAGVGSAVAKAGATTAAEVVAAAKTGTMPVTITSPSDIPKLVQYLSGQISEFQRVQAEEKIRQMVERGDRTFYVDPYNAYAAYGGGRQAEIPTWVWIASIAGAAGILFLMSRNKASTMSRFSRRKERSWRRRR